MVVEYDGQVIFDTTVGVFDALFCIKTSGDKLPTIKCKRLQLRNYTMYDLISVLAYVIGIFALPDVPFLGSKKLNKLIFWREYE